MRKRAFLVLATTAAVAASIGASTATAATEFGSGCAADTFFSVGEISVGHSSGSPLPAAAPASGVLTEWRVNVGSLETEEFEIPRVLNQELYVVRSAGPEHYLAVGKSDSGNVAQNTVNSFGARIPIQQNDLLALSGPTALSCKSPDLSDQTVDFGGLPYIGTVFQTSKPPFEGFQVPVTAKIEPDVDGDGYGDETQDKCPQSAAYQEACPVVAIEAQPSIGAKAVNVSVTTSLTAPVTVNATVALGKGKRVKLMAPRQTVLPGSIATFNLTLTPKVTKALAALAKKKSLTVTIRATAPNITGAASESVAVVKLRGHGDGPAKKHRSPKKP